MVYEQETELKLRKKRAGLTDRDLANAAGISPAMIRHKMNGFALLTVHERQLIISVIEMAESKNRNK